jgi:hypothetical protein
MLDNLINSKGGLHNRLTETIRLRPFSLSETKMFLKSRNIDKSHEQILQLYMTMGGVAHYLQKIDPKLSITQNINQLCFHPDGALYKEFIGLYASLFKHSEVHLELVELIASKKDGVTREMISQQAKLSSDGGQLTLRLKELEEAGFISSFIPYGNTKRGQYYQLYDEYSLFYLTWIKPVREQLKRLTIKTAYWENQSQSQQYHIWAGNAFEAICYKHIHEITQALDINHLVMGVSGWRTKKHEGQPGAQIDMLIERNDNAINLCEIKYHNKPFVINKDYAQKFENKIQCFKKQTTKELIPTFISLTMY